MLLKQAVSDISFRSLLPHIPSLNHIPRQNYYLHQVVREDAHLLFGFYTKQEREMFRLLLTVSGIGANTARMMLSSMSADDIRQTYHCLAIPLLCRELRESAQKQPNGSSLICVIK